MSFLSALRGLEPSLPLPPLSSPLLEPLGVLDGQPSSSPGSRPGRSKSPTCCPSDFSSGLGAIPARSSVGHRGHPGVRGGAKREGVRGDWVLTRAKLTERTSCCWQKGVIII